MFCCKCRSESNCERILKIGKHLAKLLTKNVVGLFFDSQYIYHLPGNVISATVGLY